MSPIVAANLRCEYHANPLGLDERRPRLSWLIEAPAKRRGVKQSAYQLLAASAVEKLQPGQADLWDSGKVRSDATSQVEYAGKGLTSRRRVWWTVRAWDETDAPSAWAAPAFWEMGLLAPGDWKGQWIASPFPANPAVSSPCPYFRTDVKLTGPLAKARLYASALGIYELAINGQRVGESFFTPGWTDYAIRVPYQTFDVTALLQPGANAIGGILADGWYSGFLAWGDKRNSYGSQKQLLAQLEVEYADGSRETFATGGGWKCSLGPILASDFYNGETYDARLELTGWSQPGYRAAGWRKAKLLPAPAAGLVAQTWPPVREINLLSPIARTQPEKGSYVFDLGQNMVGLARVKIPAGTKRGTKIVIRHAEVLNPDGTMYTVNLRAAKNTDTYFVKGTPGEVYQPRFTFHGFRYVELRGLAKAPALNAVTGVVLHSDTPPTGSFECSNAMLNQLQHNIVWGQKGNFLEVPTDCPQRDERLGWTGDAQVFIRTACFNMDVASLFNKWLVDLTDAQSPAGAFPMVAPDVLAKRQGDGGAGWADAGIICPWTLYLAYGDTRVLSRHYQSMAKYLAFLGTADFAKRHCFGDCPTARRRPRDVQSRVRHPRRTADEFLPDRLHPGPSVRPAAPPPPPGGTGAARPPNRRVQRPPVHRLPRHAVPAFRPHRQRAARPGLQAPPQRRLPLLGVPRQARGHHHVGALGRLAGRQGLPGPRHEQLQPLRLRHRRRLDVPHHRRAGPGPLRPGLPPRHHPPAARRRH
ncbi:MAG: family 78 glycoside hydrolase catalytic domain, partial [Planctomycetota bacterium]|nr:family 78 glycoside hydrolase catalytic domain [Planctomycetota bacterium]